MHSYLIDTMKKAGNMPFFKSIFIRTSHASPTIQFHFHGHYHIKKKRKRKRYFCYCVCCKRLFVYYGDSYFND